MLLSCLGWGANVPLDSDVLRTPRFRLLALFCRVPRRVEPAGPYELGVLSMVGRTSAGVDGSCFTPRPLTESLSIIGTSSACEKIDRLRVRSRVEPPITEEVVLAPLPYLAGARFDRPFWEPVSVFTSAFRLPRRVDLVKDAVSGAGGGAWSLIGLILRGLMGEDFRTPLPSLLAALQGVLNGGPAEWTLGVASNLAISNGL